MSADRITQITVCLRPFRAAGPRLDVETVGDKRVVHNYGHGGSGWSLAWGSSAIAVAKALDGGVRPVAVIGCGAMGLTAAITAQRAGAAVTIYAKERGPQTRSFRASGVWTPDSRIADADKADPGFGALWEQMARASYAEHQTWRGRPGDPVAFLDRYFVRDVVGGVGRRDPPGAIRFASYGDRVRGLTPPTRDLSGAENPFPGATARVSVVMQFNISQLTELLLEAFQRQGGRIVVTEFQTPADLARLSEPVIINCTGYGARALFKDETVTPVRGQIAWLPAQPEARYGVLYNNVSTLSRPDGIVLQQLGESDMWGYGSEDETPDRAESEAAAATIEGLFRRATSG